MGYHVVLKSKTIKMYKIGRKTYHNDAVIRFFYRKVSIVIFYHVIANIRKIAKTVNVILWKINSLAY